MKKISLFALLGVFLGGIVGAAFGTLLGVHYMTFSLWLGSYLIHCDPATQSGFDGGCGMSYLGVVTILGTLLGGLAGAVGLGAFAWLMAARGKRTRSAGNG
jgi:hypothetical protein